MVLKDACGLQHADLHGLHCNLNAAQLLLKTPRVLTLLLSAVPEAEEAQHG